MVIVLDQPVVCPIVVGRDQALDALGGWLDRARSGRGQTALVAGEAGIGKSRLVAEARTRARRQGFLVVEGRCFEQDRALPYAPFVDLLQTHLTGCSAEEIGGELGAAGETLVRLLPEIATSFPVPAAPVPGEPEQERRRLALALTQWITGLAVTQPVLAIVEDIHWCDDASLDVLLHLARRIATHPVLLLVTYRGDEVHPSLGHLLAELDRGRLAAELRLDRLTPADVDAMVRATFAVGRSIRSDFLDVVATLTDGNPFFVEEVLKSLVASGDIYFDGGTWNRKDLEALTIPRSVQDAVRRRATEVSDPARRVLALAAVAGRRFDFTLLQDLLDIDEDDLLAHIKELIGAQLVVEESADRFAFRHALTRQAIYADLLARERKSLHRRIGEAIERLAPAPSDLQVADLALHYAEAGVWGKALEFGWRAGERSTAMHSPRAAVEHLTRAVGAADALGLPGQPGLSRARGQAYETLGDFDRARSDYEASLAASRTAADRRHEWQALLDLGQLWASRDYDLAGRLFEDALNLAREMGEPVQLAHSLNRVGNWHFNLGRPVEACRFHDEALTIFREAGNRAGMAESLDLLALATGTSGNSVAASGLYDEVIALFRELGDRRGLVNALAMSAMPAMVHQTSINVAAETDVDVALARTEEAVAIAREIGWRGGEAFALLDSFYCFQAVGDFGRALEMARGCLAIAEEIDHRQWEAAGRLCVGSTAAEIGVFPAALMHLEEGLRVARDVKSYYWNQFITHVLVRIHLAIGDVERAGAEIDEIHSTDAGMELWFDRFGWMMRVHLALARGEPARALDILDELIATARRPTGPRPIPTLWLLRGEALTALDRLDEAATVLSDAAVECRDRRARPLLWQILLALGRVEQNRSRRVEAERAFDEARAVIGEIAATLPDGPIPEYGIESARAHYLATTAALFPVPRQPTALQAAKQAYGGLTARERDVAALIARGLSNRAIAEELIVGERTVATHVASILAKLDFASRAQIAAWAVERGLTHSGLAPAEAPEP